MNHIVFDIETVPCVELREDKALHMMQRQKLERKYKKEETIESHMADYVAGMSLEPGTAQVVAICALGTDERIFQRWSQDEATVLKDFAFWLNDQDHASVLVGFNIRKFDLPVLAAAFIRQRLPIPSMIARALLSPYIWTIDYYTTFGTGLQRFCQALGLEPLAVSGANVAELFEAKDMAAIGRHCVDDVRLVMELHKRVHG